MKDEINKKNEIQELKQLEILEESETGNKSGKSLFAWCGDLLFVLLIAAMIYIPFRYNVRYIESGSMEPGIHVGAIVLIDPTAYKDKDPQVGDIAMYQTSAREVIHRIIDESDDGYIFKGDNNDSEDYAPIPAENIRGELKVTINVVAPIVKAVKHLGL
ncbi:signal peptidase I [Clostridium sp. TM06-18]|nr:signal peptidase I [Clostridium sp. TM06-18]RHU37193.1 signal peptidase I [Clostridium sp. TM06-18]